MPEGMTLTEVISRDCIPLPTDSEAVIMKMISSADRFKKTEKAAVRDADQAMGLLNILHHEGAGIRYRDEKVKSTVMEDFKDLYPAYRALKDKEGEFYWSEEEWRAFLKFN
jgi:hypothetical protein